MIERQALLQYLNSLLEPEYFKDYAPNGLQVQGKVQIKTLVTGVTATQALIERAVELDADALFVHHGYFWRGEDPSIVGMKYNRIQCLLEHQINLFAYHLPLDAHTELGNNAQLAQRLGLLVEGGAQLAQFIAENITHSKPYINPKELKYTSQYAYMDCSKARKELGYNPRDVRISLRDSIAWFQSEQFQKRQNNAMPLKASVNY